MLLIMLKFLELQLNKPEEPVHGMTFSYAEPSQTGPLDSHLTNWIIQLMLQN